MTIDRYDHLEVNRHIKELDAHIRKADLIVDYLKKNERKAEAELITGHIGQMEELKDKYEEMRDVAKVVHDLQELIDEDEEEDEKEDGEASDEKE